MLCSCDIAHNRWSRTCVYSAVGCMNYPDTASGWQPCFVLGFVAFGGTHVGEPLNLFADSGDSGELRLGLLPCDGRVRLIADQQVCAAIRPPTSRTRHGWRAMVKCRPNAARWRPTCCRRPSRVRCAEATGVRPNSKPVVPFTSSPRATRFYAAWIGTESYRRCSATRPHDQVPTTDSNRPTGGGAGIRR